MPGCGVTCGMYRAVAHACALRLAESLEARVPACRLWCPFGWSLCLLVFATASIADGRVRFALANAAKWSRAPVHSVAALSMTWEA